MKGNLLLCICFGLLLLISSCCTGKDEIPIEPIPVATVSFATDVLPIFNTYCNGSYCHGGGSDGKFFDTYSNVIRVQYDTLIGAINHNMGFEPMPKSQPKLSQGKIDTITKWVYEGQVNN